MIKYIRIMRIDHWIKQLFIFPGLIAAIVLLPSGGSYGDLLIKTVLGFMATCFIASANYIINEWLDAEFDKYHPEKKHRSVVENDLKASIVYSLYACCLVLGLLIGYFVSLPFLFVLFFLWLMGIVYNVKPLRTKDVAYLDVLSESVNNALRLLLGWFIATTSVFPPISLVLGYWFAGAFLMATKRFSEYRTINDPRLASLYRKSFAHYDETKLLISAFFYAMLSVFFIGIFLIKYRVELILFMPFFVGLFCYYFRMAFEKDSAAQRPEKLFHERGLMLYLLILVALFAALLMIDIPIFDSLASSELIVLTFK